MPLIGPRAHEEPDGKGKAALKMPLPDHPNCLPLFLSLRLGRPILLGLASFLPPRMERAICSHYPIFVLCRPPLAGKTNKAERQRTTVTSNWTTAILLAPLTRFKARRQRLAIISLYFPPDSGEKAVRARELWLWKEKRQYLLAPETAPIFFLECGGRQRGKKFVRAVMTLRAGGRG